MKKRYVNVCITGSVIMLALVIAQYLIAPDMSLIAVMYMPLLFVPLQFIAFLPNRKRALKLKELKGWKVSESVFAETKSSHSRGNLSELPWVWYIAGFILIIVSVVVALIEYPSMPEMIPTHFDANMQPDAWSEKSLWLVLMMPLVNIATLAVIWLTGFMFVRARLQIDPQKPELSFAQHRIYRKRMGHSLGFLALSLVVLLGLIGFMMIFEDFVVPFGGIMALSFIPVVPLITVGIHSGQGGGRIKPKSIPENSAGQPESVSASVYANASPMHGDDRHWALGMFYHNPDDPAYIVEDRFGTNLGFNYSRLPVKIGVVLLALALVATYVWCTVLMVSLL